MSPLPATHLPSTQEEDGTKENINENRIDRNIREASSNRCCAVDVMAEGEEEKINTVRTQAPQDTWLSYLFRFAGQPQQYLFSALSVVVGSHGTSAHTLSSVSPLCW